MLLPYLSEQDVTWESVSPCCDDVANTREIPTFGKRKTETSVIYCGLRNDFTIATGEYKYPRSSTPETSLLLSSTHRPLITNHSTQFGNPDQNTVIIPKMCTYKEREYEYTRCDYRWVISVRQSRCRWAQRPRRGVSACTLEPTIIASSHVTRILCTSCAR